MTFLRAIRYLAISRLEMGRTQNFHIFEVHGARKILEAFSQDASGDLLGALSVTANDLNSDVGKVFNKKGFFRCGVEVMESFSSGRNERVAGCAAGVDDPANIAAFEVLSEGDELGCGMEHKSVGFFKGRIPLCQGR